MMTERGMDKGKAIRIAQSKTGLAYATGKKAKTHGGKPASKMPMHKPPMGRMPM